jgi:hypothetical protein
MHIRTLVGLLLLLAASADADRGALNPDVTQDTIGQTICVPGYAKNVRPASRFTNGVKQTEGGTVMAHRNRRGAPFSNR